MKPSALLAVAVPIQVLIAALLVPGPPSTLAQPELVGDERLEPLHSILARPEFWAEQGRSALDELLDPLRTAIWSAVREVARALLRHTGSVEEDSGPSVVGLLMTLVIVAGATLLVVRLARGTLAAEGELAASRPTGPPSAQAELDRARALASEGNLRGALHHHYLAALRRLDERELLSFHGSLTNRELLPGARSNPGLAATLQPLVETFDRLWYGQSGCSPEQYSEFASLAEAVWREAGGTARRLKADR
jgi:hypothetical protein